MMMSDEMREFHPFVLGSSGNKGYQSMGWSLPAAEKTI